MKRTLTLLTALLLAPLAALRGADLTAPAAPSLGLSVQDGLLVRNGRPYRGIGVNYFNAFGRVLADASDTSYQQGFAVLREHGIPFARFAACGFWPSDWRLYQTDSAEYFRRLDGVIAAAEQNQIGLIPSLFWRWPTIAELVGEPHSAWDNPASRTHAHMRRYTEEFVTRYRKSPAIWGWEFANEMSLGVDLPNAKSLIAARKPIPRLGVPAPSDADIVTAKTLTTALTEFGKLVRRLDQDRIIISGNSTPRPGAWHNTAEHSWTLDSREQFMEVLQRDNPNPLSVLCVHWYPEKEKRFSKEQPASQPEVFRAMMQTAQRAHKPLFIGEFGASKELGPEQEKAVFSERLRDIEQAGIPLAAVWVFDLKQQDKDWNVAATNDRAYMLKAIADANRRLSTGLR